MPFGSVKGDEIAPLNASSEHGDFDAFNSNRKGSGQEFGGRSSGNKSASLPSDAQQAFNPINASERDENSFKAPSYADMLNASGRSGRLTTTQAEEGGGIGPSSFK